MGVTNRLVFDPTDANTIAASSSIGSYTRAGTDGDLISSGDGSSDNVANTFEGLDTRGFLFGWDSAGDNWDRVQISGGKLQVDAELTADFDFVYDEDTAHTTGDAGGYVLSVRVDDLDSVPASVLAGTEGDYQSFITGPNGELFIGGDVGLETGSEIQITDGTDTLEINSNGSINVQESPCATLANTATAVSTTAVNAVSSALTDRREIRLANLGNIEVYYGTTGVTTANGFPLHPGQQACFCAGDAMAIQLIGGTGASSEDVRVLEIA